MKPVDQVIVDKGVGDCMRAAIASLLELPLDAVPHFLINGSRWWDVMWYFLYVYDYKF